MIAFNKIAMHNFGSYANTEIDLNSKGFCLVTGRNNYKKDNAFSNGSGKSLIWSAICFTLTGETISGLKTNLKNVNTEEKEAYTTLYFKVDGDDYEVTRVIAPKSDIQIIKNGVDVSGKTYRESEKKLGELLPDLTRDLIGSCMIIGQGMPNKFSAYSPSGRKDLLEKLTKCDFMIEDVKSKIVALQSNLNDMLREHDDNLLINKTHLATYERELAKINVEIADRIKPDFVANLKAIEAQIVALDNSIAEHTVNKTNYETNIAVVEAELNELITKKSAEERALNESYTTARQQLAIAINTANIKLANDKKELVNQKNIKDICPTCGQKLVNIVLPDTSVLEQTITDETAHLAELNTSQATNQQKYNEYVKQISDSYDLAIGNARTALTDLRTKIKTENDLVVNDTLTRMGAATAYTKLDLERTNWDKHTEELTVSKAKYEKDILDTTNVVNITEVARNKISDKLAVLKKIDTLTKRDFRGYLLENIIKYLDNKAKDYCETVFETRDLSIYLDGNALDISYCGKMFDNLSGGEKQRVDLILQFAIRNMLSAYLNFSANMLVLDEITDFLDKQSCAAVMKLIENELQTVESVFIVSHHADELGLPIDSELHIEKNSVGISTIS